MMVKLPPLTSMDTLPMNLKVFFIFLGQAPDKCQDTAMKAHAHLKCEILAKHIIHLEACSIS